MSKRIDGGTRSSHAYHARSGISMRLILGAVAMMTAFPTAEAAAQDVNLSGRWRCVALCVGAPGGIGVITQYGREMNMVSDAGEPSRAWVDYPGRIWVEALDQGAIYSPDGFTLQFDRGTIWQRAPLEPPPPPTVRRRG